MRPVATFSIVACDPGEQEWGVAVQSKFFAVGAIVPWARAGAGAIATQSYANVSYGPRGLEMLAEGASARDVLAALTREDEGRSLRQVGVVDAAGTAAAYTGGGCHCWAGHTTGQGYTCQGNILVPGTVEAMADRFEMRRGGTGELADWLVDALLAGQEAGGDSRGRQSAALLVVREEGGYDGRTDRYLDLRVDDHPRPIRELRRLVDLHHFYFGEPHPDDLVPLAEEAGQLQELLQRSGHYHGQQTGVFDQATREALWALVEMENLDMRWDGRGDRIDRQVLAFLRDKYGPPASHGDR